MLQSANKKLKEAGWITDYENNKFLNKWVILIAYMKIFDYLK